MAPAPPSVFDALFLALVVFVPALLYLPRLGFYSDDWAFLAALGVHPGGSLWEHIVLMFPVTDLRPGHAVYSALMYYFFGLVPAGYHLVNHLIIVLGLVILVVVLRRVGVSHALALTAVTVFGLMPSYSTLRFWFAAHTANLSLLLYLLSLSVDLRVPASGVWRAVGWRVLSAGMALASVLLYELTMPLLLLNPVAAWWVRRGRPSPRALTEAGARPDGRLFLDLAINVGIVAFAAGYKLLMSPRASSGERTALLDRLVRLIRGVLNHHGFVFGVGEPVSVWTILTSYFDLWTLLVALLAGVGVAAYLYQTFAWSPLVSPLLTRAEARRRLSTIVGLGLLVLGFGYLIFLTNDQFHFSAAGITNRVTQTGSIGAALVLTGLFGLLSTLVARPTLQRAALSTLVGLYCGVGVLIIGTVGSFWEEAYRRETAIIEDLRRAVPMLPSGSTLLLDGECAYIGPAIVFESSWDLAGVVRLLYQDRTLRADIVSARLEIDASEVWTWLSVPADHFSYPYANGILIYNRLHGVVVPIRDAGEMERYLERYNRTRDNGCPFGWPGNGVTILPRPLQGG
jgi:hypothetical protein